MEHFERMRWWLLAHVLRYYKNEICLKNNWIHCEPILRRILKSINCNVENFN